MGEIMQADSIAYFLFFLPLRLFSFSISLSRNGRSRCVSPMARRRRRRRSSSTSGLCVCVTHRLCAPYWVAIRLAHCAFVHLTRCGEFLYSGRVIDRDREVMCMCLPVCLPATTVCRSPRPIPLARLSVISQCAFVTLNVRLCVFAREGGYCCLQALAARPAIPMKVAMAASRKQEQRQNYYFEQ